MRQTIYKDKAQILEPKRIKKFLSQILPIIPERKQQQTIRIKTVPSSRFSMLIYPGIYGQMSKTVGKLCPLVITRKTLQTSNDE